MSHDDQTVHEKRITLIRSVAKKAGLPIAILQDLSGPKIRIGDFAQAPVELVPGKKLILTGDKTCVGDATRVYFNYPHIEKDIKPGMILMLDDGKRKKLLLKKLTELRFIQRLLLEEPPRVVGGSISQERISLSRHLPTKIKKIWYLVSIQVLILLHSRLYELQKILKTCEH